MRVHVWAENRSQPEEAAAMRKTYPLGIEVDIAAYLQRNEDMIVTASNRNDPMQGFDRRIPDKTDVLVLAKTSEKILTMPMWTTFRNV